MNKKDPLDEVDEFGIPLLEMALSRDQFETKIQEKLVCALREQAFVLLAKKNGKTKWVEHKESEIERIKLEILDVFYFRSKGTWNKRKAAIQAIEYYRARLKSFITSATHQFEIYYKIAPKKMISDADLIPLLDKVLASLPGAT